MQKEEHQESALIHCSVRSTDAKRGRATIRFRLTVWYLAAFAGTLLLLGAVT